MTNSIQPCWMVENRWFLLTKMLKTFFMSLFVWILILIAGKFLTLLLEVAKTLILLIRNPKMKDYARKNSIRDYFQIIEKGVIEKKVEETMQVIK